MIVSNLQNSQRIEGLHPLFKSLFDYVKTHDLLHADLGRIEVDGFVIGIFCILLSFFIFFQYMLVYEVARDPANADLIRQVYHQAQEILNHMGTTAQ